MSALVSIGLANTMCAAVLAALVWLVSRYCRRPVILHTLWLLVLVKLITPPLLPVRLAWLPQSPPAGVSAAAQPTADRALAPVLLNVEPVPGGLPPALDRAEQPTGLEASPAAAPASIRAAADSMAAEPKPQRLETMQRGVEEASEPAAAETSGMERVASCLFLVGLLWLAGTIVWLVHGLWHIARFQRLLRFARLAPAEVQEQTRKLAGTLAMTRCPTVYLLPGALPPLVWAALRRPRIFFPAGLLDQLDDSERASLLLHELAHVRRRDHWVRWLELAVTGLYWWLPLVSWVRQQLQHCEEECCDAWVIRTLPGRVYAAAILRTVDFLAGARLPLPVSASGLAGFPSLKKRLVRIMDGSPPPRLTLLSWLPLLAAAVLLPLGPSLAQSERKDDSAPTPTSTTRDETPGEASSAGDESTVFRSSPNYLVGGNNEVWGLAASSDGRMLAVGSGLWTRPGKVTLWDLAAGKAVAHYRENPGVASVAFSPDGKLLASAGWGVPARVRDAASGKLLMTLPTVGSVRVAFSDNKHLVSVAESGDVHLWEVHTGKDVAALTGARVRLQSMAVSPDGKWLAAGGGDARSTGGDRVYLWNLSQRRLVHTLSEHNGEVLGLTFSPDSKTLATTGNTDRTVITWDVASGKMRHKMVGHVNSASAVAYSPDGKVLASVGYDQKVCLWNAEQGKLLASWQAPGLGMRTVAFTPDGKTLLAGGWNLTVRRWDAATHEEQAAIEVSEPSDGPVMPITTLTCRPQGQVVALALEEGGIRVLSAQTGEVLHTLKGHDDVVTCLALSPDGAVLASGSPDCTVRLWDTASGKELGTLDGHKSWIYSLAFSADGKLLASGAYDRTIKIWDAGKKTIVHTLAGHKASVRALAFSPDGALLASGSTDRSIRLWDLRAGKQLEVLKGHDGAVRSLAFAPDGTTLASTSEDGTCKLWDVGKREVRATLKGHNGEVLSVCYSPRGKVLVTSGQDTSVRLWSPITGDPQGTLQGHGGAVLAVGFLAGGRQLVSAGAGGQVDVWLAESPPVQVLKGHQGPVRCLDVSQDGRLLLSGSGWPAGDGTMRLWDLRSGKQVRVFKPQVDPAGIGPQEAANEVHSVAFSPDAKLAASAGVGGVVSLWDVASGKEVRRLTGHVGGIYALDFSSDGKHILTGGRDKTIRLWDVQTGRQVRLFEGHTDWVESVQFSRDGRRFLSGGRDGILRLWDADSGKLIRRLGSNVGWIQGVAWSPDNRRAVCGAGNDVYIWDLETGKQKQLQGGHSYGVTCVAWSPDGQSILSGSYDYAVCWWDVDKGLKKKLAGQDGYVWSVKFSPDGRLGFSAGGGMQKGSQFVPGTDFAIRVWSLASPGQSTPRKK